MRARAPLRCPPEPDLLLRSAGFAREAQGPPTDSTPVRPTAAARARLLTSARALAPRQDYSEHHAMTCALAPVAAPRARAPRAIDPCSMTHAFHAFVFCASSSSSFRPLPRRAPRPFSPAPARTSPHSDLTPTLCSNSGLRWHQHKECAGRPRRALTLVHRRLCSCALRVPFSPRHDQQPRDQISPVLADERRIAVLPDHGHGH